MLAALDDGSELTRAELEAATGAPERQWHAQLDALRDAGQVQRSGEGKKGSPYRFSMVRKDAAQPVAQDTRRNHTADACLSAALPVRGAAETSKPAASTNGALRAETDAPSEQSMNAWLESLAPDEQSDVENLLDAFPGSELVDVPAETIGAAP